MTQVTVTVDDTHLRSISTVARSLEAKGMQVDRVMEAMGFITGSIPSGSASAVASTLRSIPGVASVDPDVAYRIAPPDSEVQ
ncbi:MAG TPA: hypothetical protein VIC62_24575 [Nakamurella sp.]|jgi:hypothetical protein